MNTTSYPRLFFRGHAKHGKKLIQELIDAGAKNPYECSGEDSCRIYYITTDGEISTKPENNPIAKEIISTFTEVKYPEKEEFQNYRTGEILLDTEGQPFLHDGRKIGDYYGCLIGYSDGILCRSNGIDRFQKKTVGIAPIQSQEWLLCEIRHTTDIPFYKP